MANSDCSSYYENVGAGIAALNGAQVLIESSVFASPGKAIYGAAGNSSGFATVHDVVLDGSINTAMAGEMIGDELPYPYDLFGSENVKGKVVGKAGQTLEFMT